MEMKWGLVPDLGGMVLLPHLIRSDVLRELTYTTRPIDGEQAECWGLVSHIDDDPLAAALALVEKIAGQSPSAIHAAKRLIDFAEAQDRAAVRQARPDGSTSSRRCKGGAQSSSEPFLNWKLNIFHKSI